MKNLMKKGLLLLCMILTAGILHAQENNDSKYLKGAVPEVEGKVVFSKEYSIPGMSQDEIFDRMLKYLADEGKAVEINTKTYQPYGGRTPVLDKDILLRFKELGGEFISLGSDSHDPERTGDKFPYYAGLVKSLGFRYLVHFENRKPVPLLL